MIQRMRINQPAVLTAFWDLDGDDVDPGAGVTVTVTRDDGTAIATAAATTGFPGTSRSLALTPAQNNKLDFLTAVWSAADGSSLTTYAEVVGGFLFGVRAARARSPLGDATQYPTDHILTYRTLAEMALEDICGVAFVPRYSSMEARVISWGTLAVERRRITKLRAVKTTSDNGLVSQSIVGARAGGPGTIRLPFGMVGCDQPIFVCAEHGYLFTPPRIGRATLELARRWLVESPWDERMTMFRSREGGEVDILTAKGDPFDLPEVVAISELYGFPLIG